MENDNKVKKKKSKALPITLGIMILIAIAVFILSYYSIPSLKIAHTSLYFEMDEDRKEITLQNVFEKRGIFEFFNFGLIKLGERELKYKIDGGEDSAWISVTPASGTFYDEKETIIVEIDRAKLSIGEHKGVINIRSSGGDKTFEILATREKDALTITSPPPNTSLLIGSEAAIRWKSTLGVFDFVNIYLLANGCLVENIANYYQYRKDDVSPGEFQWKLKEDLLPGGEGYRIKVEDAQNKELYDEIYPVSINYQFDKIQFKNVGAAHQIPSTVQYIFSLRDQFDHAVIINPSEIDWNALKIWENDEEIDYLESRAFLSTQDDFQLQVMLVLDFSSSMKKIQDGIETMVKGAKSLIDSLRETHQIGVIEFHKPQTPPSILQPFITNKNVAKAAINNFTSKEIYSDFSICWDAVYLGLEQFSPKHDPKVFKALLFLSDGFDNSSIAQPKHIVARALERNIHIYNIGVGNVHEEKILEEISKKTGGTYVLAKNICVLLERFKDIIRDLGGQYKISYITPKKPKDGEFTVKSEISYKGLKSHPPLTGKIDAEKIYGDTSRGILTFSSSSSKRSGKAEMFMWCEHTPRYVHEFHFHLDIVKPFTLSLVPSSEGGLCENWKVNKEGNGWYRLISPDPNDPKYDLEFGNSGTLCKVTVGGIEEESLVFPFKIDNSIYSLGQTFCGRDNFKIDEEGNCSININIVTSPDNHTQ